MSEKRTTGSSLVPADNSAVEGVKENTSLLDEVEPLEAEELEQLAR